MTQLPPFKHEIKERAKHEPIAQVTDHGSRLPLARMTTEDSRARKR